MENVISKGWCLIKLGELCNLVYGKGLLTKELSENGYPVFGANGIIGCHSKYIYHESKVIISCRGAASGAIHLTQPKSFVTSNSIVLNMVTKEISNEYLKYAMLSIDRTLMITGTAQPQLTIENLKDLQIPLSPLAEQHRIVAKLGALLAKVNNCKARLDKIPRLLKNFRQRVLAAAVNGELTKEWRTGKKLHSTAINFIERIKTKKSKINIAENDLPTEWISIKIGEAFEIVRGSSPRPKKDARYFSKGKTSFHWIMLSDFTDNTTNNILMDTNEYLTEEGSKYSRYVNQNDILVGVSGVYGVGRTCLLDIEGYIYDGIMAIKNVRESNFRNFINYFMQLQRMNFMDVATGTSWPNINTEILKNYLIPVPPPDEQKEIIRKVEELFAYADTIEARYKKAKAWFDKIPQAILAKAFRGELAEQDENDEPASVLLERIKKEKQTANKSKASFKRWKI
jgi:type I restriction enzyme S subunit